MLNHSIIENVASEISALEWILILKSQLYNIEISTVFFSSIGIDDVPYIKIIYITK